MISHTTLFSILSNISNVRTIFVKICSFSTLVFCSLSLISFDEMLHFSTNDVGTVVHFSQVYRLDICSTVSCMRFVPHYIVVCRLSDSVTHCPKLILWGQCLQFQIFRGCVVSIPVGDSCVVSVSIACIVDWSDSSCPCDSVVGLFTSLIMDISMFSTEQGGSLHL